MPRYATYATPRLDLGEAMYEYLATQDMYIGIKAAVVSPIDRAAGTFSKLTRESFLRRRDVKRAAGGGYNRDTADYEDQSYACYEYGLEGMVDDSDRKRYQNDFNADMDTTQTVLHALLREQEIRWATALFNTSTWTGATLYTDHSGSNPWTTTSTDVVAQINAAKEKVLALTAIEPRTLILNRYVLDLLANNDDMVARVMYTARAGHSAVASALADLLDLDQILVGRATYNSADEGSTFSSSKVWADNYAMLAVTAPDGVNLKMPCVARTMLWTEDSGSNVVVEQYREESRRSDAFRVRQNVDELVIDASYAHLLKVVA